MYTGYSALCVAQALPDDSYTISCDVDKDWTDIAQKYWKKAGVDHKIDLKLAPAIETLNEQLENNQQETYDFVFIDADKTSYDDYYELSLKLLKPGGLIAIDNVLLFGSVVDSNVLDESLRDKISEDAISAIRVLNIKIQNDDRVDISMLQIADGITLVRKK